VPRTAGWAGWSPDVAAVAILAVGVVLVVAPGPGLVVIALALAVFAIECRWADAIYAHRSAAQPLSRRPPGAILPATLDRLPPLARRPFEGVVMRWHNDRPGMAAV